MFTSVPWVQNAEAEVYSLLNVRFSSGLAALTSKKIRLKLMSSNLNDFQRVCCLYYTKREDILRSVPVFQHSTPQAVKCCTDYRSFSLDREENPAEFSPYPTNGTIFERLVFPIITEGVCVNFPGIPAVALIFLFLSSLVVVLFLIFPARQVSPDNIMEGVNFD